jgi:hypothetical protein
VSQIQKLKSLDTTTEELLEAAGYVLDEQHEKFFMRLNGEPEDQIEALKADQMHQEAIEAATSDIKPLLEEIVTLATVQQSSGTRKKRRIRLVSASSS